MRFDRIESNPMIMGGKPCIKGTRVTVGTILGQLGAGRSTDQVLNDFPYIQKEDILQALMYAAYRSEEQEVALEV
jgi:uncharacterized protein (DUF433 family)